MTAAAPRLRDVAGVDAEENQLVSVMLMGTMCFFMGVFYLVNAPIKSIRQKAWRSVSSTPTPIDSPNQ